MALTRTGTTPALTTWIGGQRWFANTAERSALSVVGRYPLGDVDVLLVHDAAPGAEAVYQVPLAPGADDAPVEALRDLDPVARLVELVLGAGTTGDGDVEVRGEPIGWEGPPPTVRTARVLAGEQSNTSVIVAAERADGTRVDLIVKVFRALHAGANPDVVLQSAIAGAGSRRVPAPNVAGAGPAPRRGERDGAPRGRAGVPAGDAGRRARRPRGGARRRRLHRPGTRPRRRDRGGAPGAGRGAADGRSRSGRARGDQGEHGGAGTRRVVRNGHRAPGREQRHGGGVGGHHHPFSEVDEQVQVGALRYRAALPSFLEQSA